MDLKKLFTHRVNTLFGFGCLLPVIMTLISVIAAVPTVSSQLTGEPISHEVSYWIVFFIPQLLYPIGSALLFYFSLKVLRFSFDDTLPTERTSPITVLALIPVFLGFSTIFSQIVTVFFDTLEKSGISLPTVEGTIPEAETPIEILGLFLVMAFLPAICEEFIYRVCFCGVLSFQSRGAAVFLSSIAFGLMHATVQQIPFAFLLGFFLGYAFLKTNNYRVPVLLHFCNNFISCLFLVLSGKLTEEQIVEIDGKITTVIAIAAGLSLIYLLLLKLYSKNKKTQSPTQNSVLMFSAKDGLKLACKAPCFWLFIVIYIGLTVSTSVSYALMQ